MASRATGFQWQRPGRTSPGGQQMPPVCRTRGLKRLGANCQPRYCFSAVQSLGGQLPSHSHSLCSLLTYLLHGPESFLSSYLVSSWSRNSPHFTEPEGSLPHSQASATCLYPGPAQSSPYTHIPPRGDPS